MVGVGFRPAARAGRPRPPERRKAAPVAKIVLRVERRDLMKNAPVDEVTEHFVQG
jgi:hypothetical protein